MGWGRVGRVSGQRALVVIAVQRGSDDPAHGPRENSFMVMSIWPWS
jgi:hypothetical protein